MSKDFLFIDESGDPGKSFQEGSSNYFAVGCLHLTNEALQEFNRHFFSFCYFHGHFKEIKSSRFGPLKKEQIGNMIKWLAGEGAYVSVAYIDKAEYAGPYFSDTGKRPYNPTFFRNFLTRMLLEKHFANVSSSDREYDLVFDHAVSEAAEDNLRKYLRKNYFLPNFNSIVQCDSRYIPALQAVDVLVHIVKEAKFGRVDTVDIGILPYIDIFDCTHPSKIQKS